MLNTKGFVHWVVIILISVMAAGLVGAAWYYEANKERDNSNTNTNQTECEQLENEIKALIEKVQYCEQNSDCIIDLTYQPSCPFGCDLILHKSFKDSENLLSLYEKIQEYGSTCPKCVYYCSGPPEQNVIKCQDNQCIDTRY